MIKIWISLTNRAPFGFFGAQWPLIAHGKFVEDHVHGCEISVRQNSDGRALVYARWWSPHLGNGDGDWCGGELLRPYEDIIAAIRRVAEDGGLPDQVVRDCIADIPPEEM